MGWEKWDNGHHRNCGGKGHAKRDEKKEFHHEGGTLSLLLHMTKHTFGTGKIIILDNGATIQQHIACKPVSSQAYLPGVLDDVGFDIFALKEPEHTMILMSTYGQLVVKDGGKQNFRYLELLMGVNNDEISFYYMEIFSNHFKYRGTVGDRNNK
eukprot:3178905-Ditylum_brightwellii.AAC.1